MAINLSMAPYLFKLEFSRSGYGIFIAIMMGTFCLVFKSQLHILVGFTFYKTRIFTN